MFFLKLKKNFHLKSKTSLGFTLVEMMVAIAVFSVVMVTAMSALLNVIDANNKAKSIKTAVNNIHFALDSISREMRVGTEYSCSTDGGNSFFGDCSTGGTAIRFKSKKDGQPYIYYKFEKNGDDIGRLFSCTSYSVGDYCSEYSPITSAEVDLTQVLFYVQGVDNSSNSSGKGRTQPYVILTISGKAGLKEKTETVFDLQTSISQRNRI